MCAIPFTRMDQALRKLGMRPPSSKDQLSTQQELEPILATMSEESMAAAHERQVKAGTTDSLSFDAAWDHPRNGKGATATGMAADGSIVELVHKRLTDFGAKHSQGLEALCFAALLTRLRVFCYLTIVMDGSQELVRPALQAGKRVAGDLWHMQKNFYKWSLESIKTLCRRPKPSAQDTADLIPVKKPKPSGEVQTIGRTPRGTTKLDHVRQRARELWGEELAADIDEKTAIAAFAKLARAHAMTPLDLRRQAAYDAYVAEKQRRAAAVKERKVSAEELAGAEKELTAWRSEIRSMLRYVSEYTATLRGAANPASGAVWTDEERGKEYVRLFREATLMLVLGRVNHPTLVLLKHAAARKDRKEAWLPPGGGFMKLHSHAFKVVNSLVTDPEWEGKLPALIDNLQT